jgi:hypothetical protein
MTFSITSHNQNGIKHADTTQNDIHYSDNLQNDIMEKEHSTERHYVVAELDIIQNTPFNKMPFCNVS